VATSSLRRRAQLLYRRPDLQIVPIRGNVETRLNKITVEDLDAAVLAEAGMVRLGLADRITEILDSRWILPAVGQGALGLECRVDDVSTKDILEELDDTAARAAITAERALLHALGGGCQAPLGALGRIVNQRIVLRAAVLDSQGRLRIEAQMEDSWIQAEALGQRLAKELLSSGAAELFRK
jgi:hydroxymethylbilane synthase